ncbi:hypothetical protein BDP27DRAFT_1426021 [Rhodocollybia butyracea]|uniref:Uncharacterized protein n=1 Tax=Rhodocollybia butyracea TaxID=206335 RepID=A0A9P5PFE7_9AGAR|nr:hypothetical protein BDP27DRAFT_1426021 [Rhodocollybia butyracea]
MEPTTQRLNQTGEQARTQSGFDGLEKGASARGKKCLLVHLDDEGNFSLLIDLFYRNLVFILDTILRRLPCVQKLLAFNSVDGTFLPHPQKFGVLPRRYIYISASFTPRTANIAKADTRNFQRYELPGFGSGYEALNSKGNKRANKINTEACWMPDRRSFRNRELSTRQSYLRENKLWSSSARHLGLADGALTSLDNLITSRADLNIYDTLMYRNAIKAFADKRTPRRYRLPSHGARIVGQTQKVSAGESGRRGKLVAYSSIDKSLHHPAQFAVATDDPLESSTLLFLFRNLRLSIQSPAYVYPPQSKRRCRFMPDRRCHDHLGLAERVYDSIVYDGPPKHHLSLLIF